MVYLTKPIRVLKLSGGDTFDHHAEGGPFQIKDVTGLASESSPLGTSPYIPHQCHSAFLINTLNGRVRLLGGELIRQSNWHQTALSYQVVWDLAPF